MSCPIFRLTENGNKDLLTESLWEDEICPPLRENFPYCLVQQYIAISEGNLIVIPGVSILGYPSIIPILISNDKLALFVRELKNISVRILPKGRNGKFASMVSRFETSSFYSFHEQEPSFGAVSCPLRGLSNRNKSTFSGVSCSSHSRIL
ncbi:predicted protein [Botrytis cinerea T4]|uniref:Uncharacterized protein n=1 Tax=Botryotinia fuckeliana (strain T4) TaxID=999810 RepID=G2Y1C7_BOTF4|nr:predicted protein [Botrytis cinerea T4]